MATATSLVGQLENKAKTTFGSLWLGDRFVAYGTLWTKLSSETAREHSTDSIKLGERGAGYHLDTLVTFGWHDVVWFVPPNQGA